MGETEKGSDFAEALKPFFLRASEAEERLSRLEAALVSQKDSGDEEQSKIKAELQSKLDSANAELFSVQKKAQDLASENAKLQYRIKHLVRTIEEANQKSERA